jgi:type I restriction enzyme S subunit
MSDWPNARLEDCCEIVSGATPSTSEPAYWGGDICWATPKDLSELDGAYISDTPRKITRAGLASCAATVLPPESVLFSSRAPIGHVAINTVPMATNQGFKSFIPQADRVHAKFLYHWLRKNRPYLESLGNGATFKEVSKAVVARIEIPLPPVLEQRRIAEVLDRAEELRAKRRSALAQLDEITQAIFLDMFGDPATNPKRWPRVSLGDVIFSASDGPHVSPAYVEQGVPFLSTRHVRAGAITWDDLKFISEADAELHWRKCKPERGDILYTKGGTTGLAASVKTDREFAVWVHIALLKPNPALVESTWLESMLNNEYCYRQSQVLTHGIANRDLGLTRMVRIHMYAPPLSAQKEFVQRASAVESLRSAHDTSLLATSALLRSLQHRAFRRES